MQDLLPEIIKAEDRIRPYILTTPLILSPALSTNDTNVYLKLENEQYTGSFKARDSLNKILSLNSTQLKHGVVAASTGNHGLGVARSLGIAHTKGAVFVPEKADPSKVKAIKKYGADIYYTKDGLSETEAHAQAQKYAKEHGMTWVSPYNDLQVIAGQGTIGVELSKQLDNIDYVFITVGGGGLISGVATYLKSINTKVKIIGCMPENSAEMYYSVKAGKFVDMESKPSIADGSAGGFAEGAITFPLCQKLVDSWVLVTEKEIKQAIGLIYKTNRKVIEGAAGVAVAAYTKQQSKITGKNIVILICGGNIAPSKLKSIL